MQHPGGMEGTGSSALAKNLSAVVQLATASSQITRRAWSRTDLMLFSIILGRCSTGQTFVTFQRQDPLIKGKVEKI